MRLHEKVVHVGMQVAQVQTLLPGMLHPPTDALASLPTCPSMFTVTRNLSVDARDPAGTHCKSFSTQLASKWRSRSVGPVGGGSAGCVRASADFCAASRIQTSCVAAPPPLSIIAHPRMFGSLSRLLSFTFIFLPLCLYAAQELLSFLARLLFLLLRLPQLRLLLSLLPFFCHSFFSCCLSCDVIVRSHENRFGVVNEGLPFLSSSSSRSLNLSQQK